MTAISASTSDLEQACIDYTCTPINDISAPYSEKAKAFAPYYTAKIARYILKAYVFAFQSFLASSAGSDTLRHAEDITFTLFPNLFNKEKKDLASNKTSPNTLALEPEIKAISEFFDAKDEDIFLKTAEKTYKVSVRIISCKNKHESGGVRFILWALNGNEEKEEKDSEFKRWDPLCKQQIAALGLDLINYFSCYYPIHTLMPYSMGNSILGGLDLVEDQNLDIIPNKIVINRGLSSFYKVGQKIFPKTTACLHGLGIDKLIGLDLDPETELLNFLKRSFKEPEGMEKWKKRTVVLIEAARDKYFSKEGAFAEDYHRKIKDYASAYRGKFTIPELSWESHHAAPLDLLKKLDNLNGCETDHFLAMDVNESVAQVLERDFKNDDGTTHTVFCIGGKLDNLDSMTRSITGILKSWITNHCKR